MLSWRLTHFRHPLWRHYLVVLLGAFLVAGCGGPTGPSVPPPPPVLPPTLTCPEAQTAESLDGQTAAVAYPAATAVGGTPPIDIACTVASGSNFSVGTTSVTCTATDQQQQTGSCSFIVTVRPPPRISATMFVAFGDSETEGKLGLAPRPFALGDPGPPFGYPFQLKRLLEGRYTAQTFVMSDEGFGGEMVATAAQARLRQVLVAAAPEVLLLMEGVNNLNSGGARAITPLIEGLRAMVAEARDRNIIVFLGTLLPQRPGGSKAHAPALIQPANDQIRALAMHERVILVDLYEAFGGSADPWIGPDGLHPNEAGYQKMAETFFAAIREELELPPPF